MTRLRSSFIIVKKNEEIANKKIKFLKNIGRKPILKDIL